MKRENEHNVFNRREEIKNLIIYKRKTTNAELRQRFNVDKKTIMNDIKFLSSYLPLRTEPGNGGGIILDISYERRMEYLRPYEKDVLLKVAMIDDALKFVLKNSKEKIAKFNNDVTTSENELGSVKRELQNEAGRLDRLKIKKEKLFQKFMDDQISDEEYMKLSNEVEREQITVEDKIRELKKKQKTVLAKKKEKETTVKTYKEIGAIKKIDRSVVEKLISKMIVSKEGRVELKWNFKNIFEC